MVVPIDKVGELPLFDRNSVNRDACRRLVLTPLCCRPLSSGCGTKTSDFGTARSGPSEQPKGGPRFLHALLWMDVFPWGLAAYQPSPVSSPSRLVTGRVKAGMGSFRFGVLARTSNLVVFTHQPPPDLRCLKLQKGSPQRSSSPGALLPCCLRAVVTLTHPHSTKVGSRAPRPTESAAELAKGHARMGKACRRRISHWRKRVSSGTRCR